MLLHLQHAFEMLLKAVLVQTGKPVFDQATGRSVGFERCIGLAVSDDTVKLPETDAGTLRAIDAMRDDEQHWFNVRPSVRSGGAWQAAMTGHGWAPAVPGDVFPSAHGDRRERAACRATSPAGRMTGRVPA